MCKQLSIAITLCAAAGGFSTAQAQVMCGDTITTSDVLTANLSCSGFDPALTIRGPGGRLNMSRFTLSCDGSGVTGILMTGSGPRLRNGTVADCFDGVELIGSRAQVSRMIARNNDGDGLDIDSGSGHRVSDTNTNNNGLSGFCINGDGNNFFNRNRAVSNGVSGFDTNNGVVGDRYTRNVATNNGDEGFFVRESSTLTGNTASQNSREGFAIVGDNNTLTNNIARSNIGDGIEAKSVAQNNTLSGNNASGNGSGDDDGDGGFDLEDDNANCDNNVWTDNTGIASQACIQ